MASVTFTSAELAALAKSAAALVPTIDINAVAKQVAAILAPGTPPVVTPPPDTTPAAGTFWLYKAGKFAGAGDYSFGSGKVTYGPSSVIVTGDEGWQPRMPNDDFDTTGYNWVVVSIKPTQQQNWQSGMLMIGDVAIPGSHGAVDITPYGPKTLVLNDWNNFKIPLSLFGTLPFHAYKIMFLGQHVPSPSTNRVEFDALGLAP